MKQRTITAFFFAAVMLGGIYGGIYTFYALFALVAAGCAWELGALTFKSENRFVRLRQIIATALVLAVYLVFAGDVLCITRLPLERLFAPACLLFVGLSTIELFLAGRQPFSNIGIPVLGIFYLALPLVLLSDLAYGNGYHPDRVLGLLLLVWINDSGAYLLGSRWGKHKLMERISPKKTWEGTLGGALFAVLGGWALSNFIPDYSVGQWAALGAVAAVGSNLGDLVESMLKRSVDVKDSGSILPGHGGFLDRFDAFIFTVPLYWLILRLLMEQA
jgi:phosphatidate cytidylyltransferase